MTDLTNYNLMRPIDIIYLKENFVEIFKSITSDSLMGVVEYYPEEGFTPKIKKIMAENLIKTEYSNNWPGTTTSRKGRIDYYSLAKNNKDIKNLLDYIMSYFNSDESDATLDFFIEDRNEIILFMIAHEEVIELNEKVYRSIKH